MSQYNALFVSVFYTSFEIPSRKTLMLYKLFDLCLLQLIPHSMQPFGKDYSHNNISDLLEQSNRQSKQTLLHFRLPSTHHSLVAINRLFAH